MIKKNIVIGLSTLLSACAPCDYEYLSKLPLESSVPAEYRENVTFVKDVRKFGIEQLGLYRCTQNYTTFTNTDTEVDGESRKFYRLFVTKSTVLPNTWEEASRFFEHNTVFQEDVPAMYFTSFEDTLEGELKYYKKEGYDVYTRNVTNYDSVETDQSCSITPFLFEYIKEWQVHTILHEICHDTNENVVGVHFPSEIEEPYCVLFGYAGTVEYFKARNGELSEEYKEALHSFDSYEEEAVKVTRSYTKLQELYQSKKSLAQKLQEREAIFAEVKEVMREEINNARLWDKYPYVKNYPLMLQLYNSKNKNLRQTLEVMKDCPEDKEQALRYIQEMSKKNNK